MSNAAAGVRPSCTNCVFADFPPDGKAIDLSKPRIGLCRNRPPTTAPLLVPVQSGPIATGQAQLSVQLIGGFPQVSNADWCGEFDDGSEQALD